MIGRSHTTTRRAPVFLALLALVLVTLVSAALAEQVTISYQVSGKPGRHEVMAKWGEDFMKLHPDIKVEPILQQDSEKVIVAIQGGTGPDLIIADWNILPSFAGNNMAMPLDSFVEKENFDLGQFYPMALNGYRYQGHLYALPLKVDTHVMTYNKGLFDQGGVVYPDDWSWDDLRKSARKLTRDINGDGDPDQYGFGIYGYYFDTYIGWIWQNGGRVYRRVNGKVKSTYNDPKTVEAFQFLNNLMYQDRTMANPHWEQANGLKGDPMFTSGRAASYFTGEWHLGQIRDAAGVIDWDIAMVPHQEEHAVELGGIGYFINPNAKNPEAAWELLKYIAASDEVQSSVVGSSMGLSPLKRMPALSFPGKRTDIMLKSMNYLRKLDMFPQWGEVYNTAVSPNLAQIWNGEADVRQTLDRVTEQSNGILGW